MSRVIEALKPDGPISGGPAKVAVASIGNPKAQLNIIDRMGFTAEFSDELRERVAFAPGGASRTLFFSQQINHLMRLALLHCADRPGDHFDDNKDAHLFVKALFGVTDQFRTELSDSEINPLLGYVLRQLGLSRPDTMVVCSRYLDLLIRVWPEVVSSEEFDVSAAFRRYTGLTIEQFLAIGFGVTPAS